MSDPSLETSSRCLPAGRKAVPPLGSRINQSLLSETFPDTGVCGITDLTAATGEGNTLGVVWIGSGTEEVLALEADRDDLFRKRITRRTQRPSNTKPTTKTARTSGSLIKCPVEACAGDATKDRFQNAQTFITAGRTTTMPPIKPPVAPIAAEAMSVKSAKPTALTFDHLASFRFV